VKEYITIKSTQTGQVLAAGTRSRDVQFHEGAWYFDRHKVDMTQLWRNNNMPKAIWNGAVLAESQATQLVEGNHYFPFDSLNLEYFRDSDEQTTCPWKGVASYYDIVVGEQVNSGAAWYYSAPKPGATHIKHYVAFWRDVEIVVD
jgi:uncharacterized protein (DUF427 family)